MLAAPITPVRLTIIVTVPVVTVANAVAIAVAPAPIATAIIVAVVVTPVRATVAVAVGIAPVADAVAIVVAVAPAWPDVAALLRPRWRWHRRCRRVARVALEPAPFGRAVRFNGNASAHRSFDVRLTWEAARDGLTKVMRTHALRTFCRGGQLAPVKTRLRRWRRRGGD
jgi:hypothetical protein